MDDENMKESSAKGDKARRDNAKDDDFPSSQQAVQATAIPVRRKPWMIVCGIASVLMLALVAIFIKVLPLERPTSAPSETSSETPTTSRVPSETPTTSRVPSETPTGTPSSSPSLSPTEDRIAPLQRFLAPYFGDGFPISETERQALHWLAYDDDAMLVPREFDGNYLNRQLLERYIVVLFYFETGGDDWDFKGGWLSENNICDGWKGLSCFDSGSGFTTDRIITIVLGEFL
jgi:hypothetical protein